MSFMQKRWIFLLVFVVNFLTMPKFEYVGDPYTIRISTQTFLDTGRLNVPSKVAEKLGERGQYFVQNSRTGLWYSKYGAFNTLLFVPPLLLEKLIQGSLGIWKSLNLDQLHVFCLNVYQIFFSLLLTGALFKLLELYSYSSLTQVVFVLSTLYGTFLWNYLRAQSTELFQCVFFLGWIYFLLKSFRNRGNASLNLKTSYLFLGFLCLAKTFYVILLPIFWIFSQKANSKQLSKSKGLMIHCVGTGVLLGTILFLNYIQFGSVFNTGYSQWAAQGQIFDGNIWDGLRGVFFEVQRSVWVHFPIFFLSLFGLKKFIQKYPSDSALIYSTFFLATIVLAKFVNWRGHWCYGPRYWIFLLPVVSLPFCEVLEIIWAKSQERWMLQIKRVVALGMIGVITYSFLLQVYVNSLHFFVYYYLWEGEFRYLESQVVSDYFKKTQFGLINRDLISYRNRAQEFMPISVGKKIMSPPRLSELRRNVQSLLRLNYFWIID